MFMLLLNYETDTTLNNSKIKAVCNKEHFQYNLNAFVNWIIRLDCFFFSENVF